MKNIFKKWQLLPLLALLAIIFYSCENRNEDGLITDVSVNVNSFTINGIPGNINNETGSISLELPYGTNLTSLVPKIDIPEGASVIPALGEALNFSQPVKFRIKNGNIYKEYEVIVKAQNPIISFKINGLLASINTISKNITLVLPENTDLTSLKPEIVLASGVTISPASGLAVNFTNPVQFTVSNSNLTEVYTAKVTTPNSGPKVAFLGTAASKNLITNPDELAAANWLFTEYKNAVYISFADIAAGASLQGIDVIWWHHDAVKELPNEALNANTVSRIKNYLNNGGNILLTTFASQYVEALGIVPAGKGPNNVFGDFLPNGFVDANGDWGMSFKGHETHPIFEGLQTYEPGKANLLQKRTFRLNHTGWWFLPEWGGYGNGEGWRTQTGGINLASEAWDNSLDGRVCIAEFPGAAGNKNCVVISMGAYDWYNETANGTPSQANGFLDNIKLLTKNTINYLKAH